MPHHRPLRLASVMALLCVLPGLLTGCDGSPSDVGARVAPVPASAPPLTDSDSSEAKEQGGGAAAGSLTTLSSGVSHDAAAGYTKALGKLRPAFDRFTSDYAHAMEHMDVDDVLAAAASLRRAVVAFDTSVRALELTAVKGQLDNLLLLNHDFIVTLRAVGGATSGAQAVRIMEMLPYRDYVQAFDAVADAL